MISFEFLILSSLHHPILLVGYSVLKLAVPLTIWYCFLSGPSSNHSQTALGAVFVKDRCSLLLWLSSLLTWLAFLNVLTCGPGFLFPQNPKSISCSDISGKWTVLTWMSFRQLRLSKPQTTQHFYSLSCSSSSGPLLPHPHPSSD